MSSINTCLKRIFTIFNIFFAIIGAFIIVLALVSQSLTHVNGGELEGRTWGLILLYAVGAITMIIAILGAYGAHKENKGCLIAFLVCMVIGTLILFRAGLTSSIVGPEVEPELEKKFRELLPLNEAPQEAQDLANHLQEVLQCCGLFSYQDWGSDIPDSCQCSEQDEMEGMCQTVGYRSMMMMVRQQQKTIYSKTCLPIIMHYINLVFTILTAVFFSLGVLALLGLILSSIIIHQMRQPNRTTVVLSVPTIFSPSPPKYQELQNPPPKYQELHNPTHY